MTSAGCDTSLLARVHCTVVQRYPMRWWERRHFGAKKICGLGARNIKFLYNGLTMS